MQLHSGNDTAEPDSGETGKAQGESMRVDFHCHSNCSDGALPPAEVARILHTAGVQFAALTDHHTTAGLEPFRRALEQYGIGYIAGLELAARHGGETVHLLAYGLDEQNPALKTFLAGKANQAIDEAPSLYGMRSAAETIDTIHAAGGIAILAHPFATQPDLPKLKTLIKELKNLSLDGIEAVYAPDTLAQTAALLDIARQLDLVTTAGTDFHTPQTDTPGIAMDIKHWRAFREALLHTPFTAQGTPGPARPKRKRNNKWFSFALNIVLPAFLSLSLFIAALFVFFLPYFEHTLMDIKRENIRQLTQAAYGVLQEAVQEEESGNLAAAEAQALAKERISAMRYGVDNKDYFWIQDATPRILMHPYRTDLNNQDVSDFTDAQGNRIFVEFADLALQKGEGSVQYVWQWMDDPGRVEAKESYIRYFEPWGWIIGTGIYTSDVQAEIDTLRVIILIISSGVIGVVLVLLMYLIRQGMLLEKSRSEAANLLVESTQRYRILSEAATEGALFVVGMRCRYANAVIYEMLGCASDRIDLLYVTDVFPDVPANAQWLQFIREGAPDQTPLPISGVMQRCNGTLLSCSLSVKQGLNDCGDGMMILVRRAEMHPEDIGRHVTLDRLLHIPGILASDLADAITAAGKATEVIALCKKTPGLVVPLLDNGTSSIAIANMISAITDLATQKFIQLAVNELGTPPAPFAFLALGSQGRQAQTLHSDQDNALMYQLDAHSDSQKVQTYFLQLATKVCDYLEAAGYEKCIGGMIAANPKWCMAVSQWKADFANRITQAQPQHIVEFCSLLDFRTVYGDPTLEAEVRRDVYTRMNNERMFVRQVAQNAVSFVIPQRLSGSLKATGNAGIDVKTPAIAIVSCARLYAIRNNVHNVNTMQQLDSIKRLGVITDARHRDIAAAYELLLRLRLISQTTAIEKNEAMENAIAPDQLGKVESAVLRESFKEIEALQAMITHDYLGLV